MLVVVILAHTAMEQEPPRKRKKSDQQQRSKVAKVSENEPAPPLPPADVPAPPLPLSDGMSLLLPHNINDSGESEYDFSALMQGQDIDCVLPTAPSLSDMMSPSEFCGSIGGTDTPPSPVRSQQDENSSSTNSKPTAHQPNGPNESSSSATKITQEISDAQKLSVCVKEALADNATTQTIDSQSELNDHVDALLDSTCPVKSEPAVAVTGDNGDVNEEGFTICTRNLVKDIVPKYEYEVLPEDWKELTHVTGMSLYCHLPTRVVTWSRPYFLNDRFAKSHDVPAFAVPCFVYRKCKELDLEKDKEELSQPASTSATKSSSTAASNDNQATPSASHINGTTAVQGGDNSSDSLVKTQSTEAREDNSAVNDDAHGLKKLKPLDAAQFTDYCSSVFVFEKKEVKKFNSWKVRKAHEKNAKLEKRLSEIQKSAKDSKCLVIPATEIEESLRRDDRGKLKRDFTAIPGTQTIIDIFYNYSHWRWRVPPVVVTKPSDSGFTCTVRIKDNEAIYAEGHGVTKKLAKEDAVKKAMCVFAPKYADALISNALSYGDKEKTNSSLDEYYKIFDTMPIKDQRIVTVSRETNQVYPMALLKACLARNFAMGENDITVKTEVDRKNHRNEVICDMSVGKFSVQGVRGKNTKIATHLAAQDLLQQLHPQLTTWGGILRLYGKFSDGSNDDLRHRLVCEYSSSDLEESGEVVELPHCGNEGSLTNEQKGSDQITPVARESSSTQTDVGGLNAFYSRKSLKPFVVLEEGVCAYEHYSSEHGSYILLAEGGMQTVPVGHSTFHKATQMPDMSYNPYTNKNVLKPATGEAGTPSTLNQESEVPSAKGDAPIGRLHKATQYPDKEYADPGHPPAPSIVWPDAQQFFLQQQQQLLVQQQLALQQPLSQQPLQYYYVDQTTGLPITTPVQPHQLVTDQQQWPYAVPQYPPGCEQQ